MSKPKQTLLQPILIITPTRPPSSSWLTLFVRELDSNTNSVVISSTEDKFKSATTSVEDITTELVFESNSLTLFYRHPILLLKGAQHSLHSLYKKRRRWNLVAEKC
jgi:hypothetical protein